MHTILESIVYCNAQNLVHLYAFVVNITAFGFALWSYTHEAGILEYSSKKG